MDSKMSHIDFIQSLDKEKSFNNGEAFSYSLANEDYDCLKYVLENNYKLPPSKKELISNVILTFADEDNICKCIKLLYDNNFRSNKNSYLFANNKNNLKVVSLLEELDKIR